MPSSPSKMTHRWPQAKQRNLPFSRRSYSSPSLVYVSRMFLSVGVSVVMTYSPLAEEGWMRRAQRGADGVVGSAETLCRTGHPGARACWLSRHPSSARASTYLTNQAPMRGNFEIGRILHLKSEIRNF